VADVRIARTAAALSVLACVLAGGAGAFDGQLDPTFGSGGKVVTPLGDVATALVVEPDGGMIVAGRSDYFSKIVVARYLADGTLDASFGSGGIVATPVVGSTFTTALARQPDGKLVMAGATGSFSLSSDVVIMRYQANGALDASFGGDGSVTVDVDRYDSPRSLLLQPDGGIVVLTTTFAINEGFRILRFHPDGSPDPGFGVAGRVIGPPGFTASRAVLQPDGRIVVVGYQPNLSVAVHRFLPDGTLDPTFGTNGTTVIRDLLLRTSDYGVALQPDGGIVVSGSAFDAPRFTRGFGVARLDAGGTLDPSFGTAGGTITVFNGDYAEARAIVLQPDGRIVVAGRYFDLRDVPSVALARYWPDGTLDATFAPCATVTTPVLSTARLPSDAEVGDLARTPAGKLVAAGFAPDGLLIVRYGAPAVTGCQPALPGSAKLVVRQSPNALFGQRTKLKWQWRSSAAVAAADFGDPTVGTGVSLCLVDQTADSPLLTFENPPRAGRPYWTRTRAGFSHKPGTRDFTGKTYGAFGLVGLSLGSGGPGQATIRAKQNTFLDVPLPFTGPVRVRLATSDTTACFEAVFPNAAVNDATRYQAVSE
jgi:uncharacterized delta-60 repeat protein